MEQQQRVRPSPEQIVEEAKPGWRVASGAFGVDAPDSTAKPDLVMPEVNTLMRKYFGSANPEAESLASADSAANDDSALVTIEPKEAQDIRAGRKAVYVTKGQIFGEQG